jgi:5-methylcytosine-specific restriction endonuclease McrA
LTPLKPCLTCGRLGTTSYCIAHRPRNGSTRQWRTIRASVLASEPLCALCGRPAQHVDHIHPIALGGTDSRANLQALCAACNLRKGDR